MPSSSPWTFFNSKVCSTLLFWVVILILSSLSRSWTSKPVSVFNALYQVTSLWKNSNLLYRHKSRNKRFALLKKTVFNESNLDASSSKQLNLAVPPSLQATGLRPYWALTATLFESLSCCWSHRYIWPCPKYWKILSWATLTFAILIGSFAINSADWTIFTKYVPAFLESLY